jgi:aryl-alcohol dehydrogenase-like predicted oxidoreductase
MQHHYNLLAREEEREMLPLCAAEGIGTIAWSPLARGRLARNNDMLTGRSTCDRFADLFYRQTSSDLAILGELSAIAHERGVSRAQIALAWLRRHPVFVAPLVGASQSSHLRDALESLDIELTDDEALRMETPYTPRDDFQAISDDAELARIATALDIFTSRS